MIRTKKDLLEAGLELVSEFSIKNQLPVPRMTAVAPDEWPFDACAYWRRGEVRICLELCARPGTAGRSWSWPGYIVDRTPYGVMAHELGHHVDWHRSTQRGAYFGDFSKKLREQTKESRLTTYCPNDAEWFAEIFRLFVTNPSLVATLRPRTFKGLRELGLEPVITKPWREVLADAPERTLRAAESRIAKEGVR